VVGESLLILSASFVVCLELRSSRRTGLMLTPTLAQDIVGLYLISIGVWRSFVVVA